MKRASPECIAGLPAAAREKGGTVAAVSGTVEANKLIALGLLDAIVRGDLARIDTSLHPDCTWWVQGWGAMPGQRFLESLRKTIDRSRSRSMKILGVTAEEDRVAVAAEGMFEFPEGVYANSYHYLFTMLDGHVLEGREYLDTRVAAEFFSRK